MVSLMLPANQIFGPEIVSTGRQLLTHIRPGKFARSLRKNFVTSSLYNKACGDNADVSLLSAENNNYAATVTEENGSDRGYHSDQSPDSLVDKPIHIAKSKKHKEAKNPRSARRSLSTSQG